MEVGNVEFLDHVDEVNSVESKLVSELPVLPTQKIDEVNVIIVRWEWVELPVLPTHKTVDVDEVNLILLRVS